MSLRFPDAAAFDVVGLGVNVLDELLVVDGFPEPDTKVDALTAGRYPGGVTATAVVTCARLGLRAKYVGKVGDDDLGLATRKSLETEGVDVADVLTGAGEATRSSIGLVERFTGRRLLVRRPGPRCRLRAGEVRPAAVTAGRVLHLDGYDGDAALEAAQLARHAGIPVSLDAEEATERCGELVKLADVLIVTRDFARALVGVRSVPDTLAELRRRGPTLVGLTRGAEGAVVTDGEVVAEAPAFPVRAQDTTGAGDVFHGAMLAGLLWRWPLATTTLFAAAVAALKCRDLGGQTAIPSLAEALAFFRAHGLPHPGA
jgi:sugar/nucleoside kinase (ribokinase family)